MTRALAVLLLAIVGLAVCTTAVADDTNSGTNDNGLWISQSRQSPSTPRKSTAPSTRNGRSSIAPAAGSAACLGADRVVGEFVEFAYCGTNDPQPKARPALTLGLIRSAFAELPLPAGTLVIQPPDGLTLVNFATNFYTSTTRPTTRTVTLLHRRVTLQATPTSYHWHFGDGSATTTAEPGAPYPRLGVTHDYRRTGTYRPRLDTTYSGRYRVGGGPWRTIPGTVTIDGEPQSLRAIEAEPKLVPY